MRDYVSFFRRLYSLSMDIDFHRAQNELAENAYDVLAEAYSSSALKREREEIIVEKICNAFKQNSFPSDIAIYAEKIHGYGASGVQFRNALRGYLKIKTLKNKDFRFVTIEPNYRNALKLYLLAGA